MDLAAWCYYSDIGINEKGETIEIIDDQKGQLHQAAKQTKSSWKAFLQQRALFGNLVENQRFIRTYEQAITSIYQDENIRTLMNGLLKQSGIIN